MDPPNTQSPRPFERYRAVARGLLIVTTVASQCMLWWPQFSAVFRHTRNTASSTVDVTVRELHEYGAASVVMGGAIGGRVAAADEAAAESLARAISEGTADGQLPSVTLDVSGGVRQQELETLRKAILLGTEGRPVTIVVQSSEHAGVPATNADSASPADAFARGE